MLRTVALRTARRGLTTAAPVAPSSVTAAAAAPIPLGNVEAQWARLSADEQLAVHQQLEALQKKDWKELSLDEKKAAYYVAFGPHGPRTPINPAGTVPKVIFGVAALIASAGLIYSGLRSLGAHFSLAAVCALCCADWACVVVVCSAAPAADADEGVGGGGERAREGGQDQPYYRYLVGGYSGKGFVQSK